MSKGRACSSNRWRSRYPNQKVFMRALIENKWRGVKRAFCSEGPRRREQDATELSVECTEDDAVHLNHTFFGMKMLDGCFGRLTGCVNRGRFCVGLGPPPAEDSLGPGARPDSTPLC